MANPPTTQTAQQPLDPELMEILRCPSCRSTFAEPGGTPVETLSCTGCGAVYPVRNGVPVLLVDEAQLPEDS